MKKVALIALLFCAAAVHARDLRPELVVDGRADEISVSPAGALWFGTKTGRVYHSDDGGRSWSEAAVPAQRVDFKTTWNGDHLDRVVFFDADRALITGWIGEQQDLVFRTENGGATWTPVRLPSTARGLWVYDTQATSDGHAWLVGSNGSVMRSDDYGLTWRHLTRPFDQHERTLSVWFATPDLGVVSTLFSGDVAVTRDGGVYWSRIEAEGRDAVLRGCEGAHDKRAPKVRIAKDRVIVEQCGGVFATALEPPRRWTRLDAAGKPLVKFDVTAGGDVVGVTAEGDVHRGDRALGMHLPRVPMAIDVEGDRIVTVDPTMKVAAFDGQSWVFSRMFGKGTATSWPIGVFDRGEGDVLWGISSFFLYRSDDAAKTWDRVAELPEGANSIFIQDDGNLLLANGHGWVGRWNVAAKSFSDVPGLHGLDIVGSFRRRDLWLVHGGRQYDTAGRVEVAQTFFAGQFAGSANHGFVAASADGGRTWKVIDQWDEGPQAIFLSDDNRLTLLSWLCGLRQGTVSREPLAASMRTLLRGEDRKRTPYVQQALVLDLLNPSRGWIVGWIHHLGNVAYRTADGGRTWKSADRDSYPNLALHRLFDGAWIGVTGTSLLRWNRGRFEALHGATGEMRQVRVDSRGGLLVQTGDAIRVIEGGKARPLSVPPE